MPDAGRIGTTASAFESGLPLGSAARVWAAPPGGSIFGGAAVDAWLAEGVLGAPPIGRSQIARATATTTATPPSPYLNQAAAPGRARTGVVTAGVVVRQAGAGCPVQLPPDGGAETGDGGAGRVSATDSSAAGADDRTGCGVGGAGGSADRETGDGTGGAGSGTAGRAACWAGGCGCCAAGGSTRRDGFGPVPCALAASGQPAPGWAGPLQTAGTEVDSTGTEDAER